jgi:TolB protein
VIKPSCKLVILLIALFSTSLQAELNIEITQGMAGAVPIAVPSFDGPKFASDRTQHETFDIAEIIGNDLRTSGRFRPVGGNMPRISNNPADVNLSHWKKMGVENIIVGQVQPTGNNRYNVSFELWDVFKAPNSYQEAVRVEGGELVSEMGRPHYVLSAKRYQNVKGESLRALGHHISDVVFETLTGIRGAFSTRIAYVLVRPSKQYKGDEFILEVADMDGFNPKALVKSKEPIMSPSWSPNGKKLAFVSFEKKESEIYIIDLATGKRELVSTFEGINGAPAWSPDGRKLALVLSKDGSPKIYIMDLATKRLTKITKGYSIDTEPAWAPDGRSLFFTSNRGGKPQIYKVSLSNARVERVTFAGNYNARPSVSQDGKKLVMIHRANDGVFRIASQNLLTGEVNQLTHAELDESPSLAPNGAMVLYGTSAYGRRVLGVVTIDGRGQLRLPAREGSVQEPAWSPYLS